jgi:hypothetical protein
MKLNPTPQALRDLFTPAKPRRRRLPGEPRDFTPKQPNGPSGSLRNLTPPQRLGQVGDIISSRVTEVSSNKDPLWTQVLTLRTERDRLRQEVAELREVIFNLTRPTTN